MINFARAGGVEGASNISAKEVSAPFSDCRVFGEQVRSRVPAFANSDRAPVKLKRSFHFVTLKRPMLVGYRKRRAVSV